MMEFTITEIKALDNIKLSRFQLNIDKSLEWVSLPSPVIWKEGKDTVPAAFFTGKNSPARLDVTIKTSGALTPGNYTLTGSAIQSANANEFTVKDIIFSGSRYIENGRTRTCTFRTKLEKSPRHFLGIDSEFQWRLSRSSDSNNGAGVMADANSTTLLELYWLYGYDGILFPPGVPLELLRQLNLGCTTLAEMDLSRANSKCGITGQSENKKQFIIRAAVNSCFLRNPPRYDVTQKSSRYIQYDSLNDIHLKLADYLWSLNNPSAVCNCFDQAAVLQTYLKAIGIMNVKYVVMGPRFYLRLTYLVGWGWCNNPAYNQNYKNDNNKSYMGKPYMPVTSPFSQERSFFYQHAICGLHWHGDSSQDKKRIIDSCTGPHTGDQTPKQYTLSAVDELRTDPCKIKYVSYYGVTQIDITTPQQAIHDHAKAAEFNAIVNAPPHAIHQLSSRFLAPTWPDLSKISVFKNKNWKLIYQHITPGPGETMKNWLMRYNSQTVTIRIYTASYDQYKQWARNRFITIGTSTTMPHIPFKKGPAFLGPFSVTYQRDNNGNGRYVWQSYNIVFDVSFDNVTFHPNILLKWLHKKSIRKPCRFINYKNYPANMGFHYNFISIGASGKVTHTLRTGESFEVSTKQTPANDLLYYFMFSSGRGLRFTDKTSGSMTFNAHAPSENTLVVIAVHRKKLLSAFKTFYISVK